MHHRYLAAGALLAFASAASQAATVDLSSRLHSMDVDRTDRDDLSFATVSGFAPGALTGYPHSPHTIAIDWGDVPALAVHAGIGDFAVEDRAWQNHSSITGNDHTRGTGMDPFRPGQWGSHAWHHGHAPPVPEPGTVALWLAGLGVIGFLGVRRKLDR